MLRYITKRLFGMVAMLFVVAAVVFVIFDVLPSADPAALRAGRNASPEQIEQIRGSLCLDNPTAERFVDYVKGVFTPFETCRGETGPFYFGTSIFQNNEPVTGIILDRLPATIFLVSGAVLLWIVIAVPVGTISAIRRRSLLDRTTMITTLAFISAPVFWLGLVSLYLFAQDVGQFSLFPGIGAYSDATGFFSRAWSLVLPWSVLALATAAIYSRYIRAQMIDVMSEDYVRTARAKGVAERQVVVRHGLRSAITPVVTLLGLDIGTLLAGNAILTESVFNIPGVGNEIVEAIGQSDYELIQGIVLFGAFFIVILNLVVDVLYAYLDPRVRY